MVLETLLALSGVAAGAGVKHAYERMPTNEQGHRVLLPRKLCRIKHVNGQVFHALCGDGAGDYDSAPTPLPGSVVKETGHWV
jgi:hypothetical protein